MGSGNGGRYTGTGGSRSISMNLTASFKKDYDYHDGYFGVKGQSKKKDYVRNFFSPSPEKSAQDFYARLTKGGKESRLDNGKGFKTEMADGTVVTFRRVSSSDGSPAIDINIEGSNDSGGIKLQKIHFVVGGKK